MRILVSAAVAQEVRVASWHGRGQAKFPHFAVLSKVGTEFKNSLLFETELVIQGIVLLS